MAHAISAFTRNNHIHDGRICEMKIARSIVTTAAIMAVLSTGFMLGSAPSGARQRGREGHPEINQAIDTLNHAKDQLNSANSDFKGHKQKALNHIAAAIAELRMAIKAD